MNEIIWAYDYGARSKRKWPAKHDTIFVSPTGREKTGYPTQKPLGVLERIVKVHSNPEDTVLDFFAGSGTTGEAPARNGRDYILVDSNPEAARVMARRLAPLAPSHEGFAAADGIADRT